MPRSQAYEAIPKDEERSASNPLRRTVSEDHKHGLRDREQEPGTRSHKSKTCVALYQKSNGTSENVEAVGTSNGGIDETSSLISSNPGDVPYQNHHSKVDANHDSPHVDIRGFALLKHTEFYQLWLMLGILTGVGLMTIK